MNVSKLESNLLDLVTAVAMVPVAALYALLDLLWAYRKYIGLALAIAGAAAACWACPALPLGLAITAVVGWATMPRSPRAGWGLPYAVSWNSFALKAVSYAKS